MTNDTFIERLDALPPPKEMLKAILKQEGSIQNVVFASGLEMSFVSRLLRGERTGLHQHNLFKVIKRFVLGKSYHPTDNLVLRRLAYQQNEHQLKWWKIAKTLKVTTPFLASVMAGRIELSDTLEFRILEYLVENVKKGKFR